MKDKTTAIILSALLGGLGVDRFYLGYTGIGVLKLLTGGCFGILWILDIINIATGKLLPADGSQYGDSSPTPDSSASDVYEELRKLAQPRDSGVLDAEEFAKLKADYIAKM